MASRRRPRARQIERLHEAGIDGKEQQEAQQLMKETNIYELMEELNRKFR